MEKIYEVIDALTAVEGELERVEEVLEMVEDTTEESFIELRVGSKSKGELPAYPVRVDINTKTRFNIAEVLRFRGEQLIEACEQHREKLKRVVDGYLGEEAE